MPLLCHRRLRSSVVIAAAAGLVVTLAACGSSKGDSGAGSGSSAPKSDVTLTWVSTGGAGQEYMATYLQKPFTAATGVKFANVSPFSVGQLQTQVNSKHVSWDIIATTPAYAFQYCGKLFAKLDLSLFDKSVFPPNTMGDCVIPGPKYAVAFAYNQDVYKGTVPTKLTDFFDTAKFPGKRVIYDQPNGIFEMALLADGVQPDALYPLDIDRALKKLSTIKNNLIIAPSYTALQQDLVSKQAAMTITLTGRLAITKASGANLVPVWDTNMWDYSGYSVAEGTPNLAIATQALVTALAKDNTTNYSSAAGLTPIRTDVDPSTVKQTDVQTQFNPFLPDRGTVTPINEAYYGANQLTLTQRWTAWKVGG